MLAGAVVASLVACGNRGTGDVATTTTSPPSMPAADPTTSTTLDPATEVEQAYLAFENMFTRLRASPDPEDPEIGQRTTGQTKNGIINSQTTMATARERVTFGDRQAVHVLGVEFNENDLAVVQSCAVEDITVTNAAGSEQRTLATYWTDYLLSRIDGEWLVGSSEAIKKVEGERSCDE
jgi:hypothetical protein